MEQIARMIVDMLNTEAMTQVRVAYGNPVSEIKDVSRSYKEAKMALDVGKIFYAEKNIVSYTKLGIDHVIVLLGFPGSALRDVYERSIWRSASGCL